MAGHLFLAVATFVITNIDDLLIITFYFSTRRYATQTVVAGQYIGIIVLILVSLAGLLVKDLIPETYLGFLGVFPILLGIKELKDRDGEPEDESSMLKASRSGILAVALVTVANGGDNIGVYTPLFLSMDSAWLSLYIAVFLALTAVLCYLGYYFVNHPVAGKTVTRYGNMIMPYFLILLGIWILSDLFL